MPTFKNEIAPDPSEPAGRQQPQLDRDRSALEEKIEKLEERIEQLAKMLTRSCESNLHNKANDLQEELCMKKFDLMAAQIHLSAVRSQLQLFEYNFRPISAFETQATGGDFSAMMMGSSGAGGDLGTINGSMGTLASIGTGGAGTGGQQALGLNDALGGVAPSSGARRSPSTSGSGLAASLGYRHKWIKAFKSLKETPGQQQAQQQSR